MPAGEGALLETVSREIAARAATVRFNARTDEPGDPADYAEDGDTPGD
jgi:hypothetical protein